MDPQQTRQCQSCGGVHRADDCSISEYAPPQRIARPKPRVSFLSSGDDSLHSKNIINLKHHDRYGLLHQVSPYEEVQVSKTEVRTLSYIDAMKKSGVGIARSGCSSDEPVSTAPLYSDTSVDEVPVVTGGQLDQMVVGRRSTPKRDKNKNKKKVFKLRITNKNLIFAVVLLIIVALPIPVVGYMNSLSEATQSVVDDSTGGFLALQASTVAALHGDVAEAESGLDEALMRLNSASDVLTKDYHVLISVAKFIPYVREKIISRQNLLEAGHNLARGNTYLVQGIKQLDTLGDASLTDKLSIFRSHLDKAIPYYEDAAVKLSDVDTQDIPLAYQSKFNQFRNVFTVFVADMGDMADIMRMSATIFGEDSFKRYIIIFQNPHELRATGGFMGSYAVLDMQKGKILNIDVPSGGTYDVQGQLTERVKPPLPLQIVNKRWEMQDANWFPDFPTSAKKIQWFYERSRGRTVDGVIAINATVLERLLRVMGPIVTEDGGYFSVDNALEDLQYEVEVGYDRELNTPKKVIGQLLESVIGSFSQLDAIQIVALIGEMSEALDKKEVQIQMNDIDLEEDILSFGWGGELNTVPDGEDYLHISLTNISGGKSDAVTTQEFSQDIRVSSDGSVEKTVRVIRKHGGIRGQRFYGEDNISYVRIYVPEGAELLDVQGAEFPSENSFGVPERGVPDDQDLSLIERLPQIDQRSGTRITSEFGKTVFANWLITRPGEVSTLEFTYRLPFRLSFVRSSDISLRERLFLKDVGNVSVYNLTNDRQSGVIADMDISLTYPEDWLPMWSNDDRLDFDIGRVVGRDIGVDTDTFFSVIMQQ